MKTIYGLNPDGHFWEDDLKKMSWIRSRLPQTAVLEYPMQGLKLTLGDREYTAWAVQNRIDPEASYFVKFSGEPDAVIFGPLGEGDDADVFVLDLK